MYINLELWALPSIYMPGLPFRILIADDSALIRTKLTSILSARAGWTVCGQAADGREAVLLAAEQKPDAILLDFSMPWLSGIQAATEILKILPRVPIVLYTLYDDAHTEAAAKKAGIRKVIPKSKSADLVADLEEVFGKPHDCGPLGIDDEYLIEPVSGEEAAISEPKKTRRGVA